MPIDSEPADESPSVESNADSSTNAGAETPTEKPVSAGLSPAIAAVGFVIITLLGVLLFQNIGSKPGSGDSYVSPSMASAKADLETRRAELNRARISMGLEPISTSDSVESAELVAGRLKNDAETLAALAKSFETLIRDKDIELDGLRQQNVSVLQDQKRLRELLDDTKRDLDRALMDASYATTLKSDLEAARGRITSLQEELQASRELPQSLRDSLARSESENAELRRRLAELEDRLSNATLFAGTESEIRKEAVELYQALQNLEGKADSEISTAYSRFGAKLGANVMRTCTFTTGSSEVDPSLAEELSSIAQEAPDGAMLFVVGYASETGNVDANRSLSSDRATNVARLLDQAKNSSQKVQAAYLGQTDRFSSRIPERNQIVEIWEISGR